MAIPVPHCALSRGQCAKLLRLMGFGRFAVEGAPQAHTPDLYAKHRMVAPVAELICRFASSSRAGRSTRSTTSSPAGSISGRRTSPRCSAAAAIDHKIVVLTGAMVPYAFGSSDGLFNLGSAISYVQSLPPGVYIAMNGTHFDWHNVQKNRETGVFEVIR